MQMTSNANISDDFWVFHEIFEVWCRIICFEWFVEVILFCLDFGDDGSLQGLPVLLLDHYLSFGVHFLMGLIVFFVFVEDDAMFVGKVDHFDILAQLGLLLMILMFGLRWFVAVNLWTDVVSELVIQLLVHAMAKFYGNLWVLKQLL
jgi:hypothetical protein